MLGIERRNPAVRIRYADLSEDRDATIERLMHFLGLERTDTPSNDHATHAAERGIHTSSVAAMQLGAPPRDGCRCVRYPSWNLWRGSERNNLRTRKLVTGARWLRSARQASSSLED